MRKAELELHCARCGAKLRVDVRCVLQEDDSVQLVPKDINTEWVERWANSHQEPSAVALL